MVPCLVRPDIDDILREKTFKDQGLDLSDRVFSTLDAGQSLRSHRNSKAIGLLVQHLHDRGILSEAEIDELLLECIK